MKRVSTRNIIIIMAALVAALLGANNAFAATNNPPLLGLNVAIVGDVGSTSQLDTVKQRVGVINGPNVDPSVKPNAIEIVTDMDLGPNLDQFSLFDSIVNYAKSQSLYLFLRIKPRVSGTFEKAKFFDLIGTAGYKDSTLTSFFDASFETAARNYFRAVATKYANDPTVIGYVIAIGPNGEAQYKLDGASVTDFGTSALNDYKSYMSGLGLNISNWPNMPVPVAGDTQLSYTDQTYYHWAYWRVKRLNELLSQCASEIKAKDPEAYVGVFSYIEPIAAAAGYGPGFIGDDANFDFLYSSISLDHGWFYPRNQDRSRPIVLSGTSKVSSGEFDMISAYTDATHMEAFVRYFLLMKGQPRPFMPTWWNTSTTSGGWSQGFWANYSDDLARQMTGLVNANRYLTNTESVADVAVISPNLSGMAIQSNSGVLLSAEFMISHTDIVRQLSAIGSNFDVLSEDTLTAAKLNKYKLVIVLSPALYPWVRTALNDSTANVMVMGWAGMISAPGPGDMSYSPSWLNSRPSWWPTKGSMVQRKPQITFMNDPLLGPVAGKTVIYGSRTKNVSYASGLTGTALAKDELGNVVFSHTNWNNSRHIYHFGLPLNAAGEGYLLSDSDFRAMLTNLLKQVGCTAYGDLGPLRLYETSNYLLVENPKGTTGTLDTPAGDYVGTLINQLKNPPQSSYLDEVGRIKLNVPAGKSIIIPLTQPTPPPAWTWKYDSFTGASGLIFVDNATAGQPKAGIMNDGSQDVARLGTSGSSVSMNSMWRAAKVQVRDGFTTQFRLRYSGGVGWANGLEFIVSNNANNEALGVLGRHNQMLGIKFDDHNDPGEGDIPEVNNNLGIKLGDNNPAVGGMVNLDRFGIDLRDGHIHTVTITYSGPSQGYLWNVYIDNVHVVTDMPVDLAKTENATTHNLDWQDYDANGEAWIGITGGTGGSSQNQDILSWTYGPPTCGPLPTSLGGKISLSGCSADLSSAGATIQFFQNNNIVRTDKLFLQGDGSYLITTLQPGTYDVTLKVPGWLRKKVPGLVIGGPTDIGTVLLTAGDINGNNSVETTDFSVLSGNFGQDGD